MLKFHLRTEKQQEMSTYFFGWSDKAPQAMTQTSLPARCSACIGTMTEERHALFARQHRQAPSLSEVTFFSASFFIRRMLVDFDSVSNTEGLEEGCHYW